MKDLDVDISYEELREIFPPEDCREYFLRVYREKLPNWKKKKDEKEPKGENVECLEEEIEHIKFRINYVKEEATEAELIMGYLNPRWHNEVMRAKYHSRKSEKN